MGKWDTDWPSDLKSETFVPTCRSHYHNQLVAEDDAHSKDPPCVYVYLYVRSTKECMKFHYVLQPRVV